MADVGNRGPTGSYVLFTPLKCELDIDQVRPPDFLGNRSIGCNQTACSAKPAPSEASMHSTGHAGMTSALAVPLDTAFCKTLKTALLVWQIICELQLCDVAY